MSAEYTKTITKPGTTPPPAHLLKHFPSGHLRSPDDADIIPATPGAYLLLLEISTKQQVSYGRVKNACLTPGWYIYAGNANGSGGLKARLTRHMRNHKKPHWHIDQLTSTAQVHPVTFANANECGLIQQLMITKAFSSPLSGFGSSDCKKCESHFLQFTEKN